MIEDALSRLVYQLRRDLWDVAHQLARDTLRQALSAKEPTKRKLKAVKPRPVKSVRLKAVKPRPTRITVGSSWMRRDGNTPRVVRKISRGFVVIGSPIYKQGTKVKLAEFFHRYKPQT